MLYEVILIERGNIQELYQVRIQGGGSPTLTLTWTKAHIRRHSLIVPFETLPIFRSCLQPLAEENKAFSLSYSLNWTQNTQFGKKDLQVVRYLFRLQLEIGIRSRKVQCKCSLFLCNEFTDVPISTIWMGFYRFSGSSVVRKPGRNPPCIFCALSKSPGHRHGDC